jgi:hypothetical protein
MQDEHGDENLELKTGQPSLREVLSKEIGSILHHEPPKPPLVAGAEPLLSMLHTCTGLVPNPSLARQSVGEILILTESVSFEGLIEQQMAGDLRPDAHERPMHEFDVLRLIEVDQAMRIPVSREAAFPPSSRKEESPRRMFAEHLPALCLEDSAGGSHDVRSSKNTFEMCKNRRMDDNVIIEEARDGTMDDS